MYFDCTRRHSGKFTSWDTKGNNHVPNQSRFSCESIFLSSVDRCSNNSRESIWATIIFLEINTLGQSAMAMYLAWWHKPQNGSMMLLAALILDDGLHATLWDGYFPNYIERMRCRVSVCVLVGSGLIIRGRNYLRIRVQVNRVGVEKGSKPFRSCTIKTGRVVLLTISHTISFYFLFWWECSGSFGRREVQTIYDLLGSWFYVTGYLSVRALDCGSIY